VLGGPLMAPMLRLLADEVEAVREAAGALLGAVLERAPDAPALVPAVAAALVLRLAGALHSGSVGCRQAGSLDSVCRTVLIYHFTLLRWVQTCARCPHKLSFHMVCLVSSADGLDLGLYTLVSSVARRQPGIELAHAAHASASLSAEAQSLSRRPLCCSCRQPSHCHRHSVSPRVEPAPLNPMVQHSTWQHEAMPRP